MFNVPCVRCKQWLYRWNMTVHRNILCIFLFGRVFNPLILDKLSMPPLICHRQSINHIQFTVLLHHFHLAIDSLSDCTQYKYFQHWVPKKKQFKFLLLSFIFRSEDRCTPVSSAEWTLFSYNTMSSVRFADCAYIRHTHFIYELMIKSISFFSVNMYLLVLFRFKLKLSYTHNTNTSFNTDTK